MQLSGVESAIRELQGEIKKIQKVISALRRIQTRHSTIVGQRKGRGRRRLSAEARRKISLAAKKRWAALRASKKK